MKRYRKFFTSGVAFAFAVVGTTGVIFKLFFKNHVLEEIHGWIGLGMFTFALVHVVQNWPQLRNHFRDWRVFWLLLPIALVAGFFTLNQKPGGDELNSRTVLHQLSTAHADDIAKTFGKDIAAVQASMQNDGLQVADTHETIQELARQNHKPPEKILGYFVH